MIVAVFGLGYVGTVTAACLGASGHRILGVDPHPAKTEALRRGESPVHEPGVGERLAAAAADGRLAALPDAASAVAEADIAIVCVGTPPGPDGAPDLSHVETVFRDIAAAAAIGSCRCRAVALRSTVPPGTTRRLAGLLDSTGLEVLFIPEFLREGNAVEDFFEPTLAVVGTASGEAPAFDVGTILPGDVEAAPYESAELLKYGCNAFHAVKVVFANDIGRIAKRIGVDGRRVMELLCRDTRLNVSARYLRPGNPYGGSCLPKDVGGLLHQLPGLGVDAPLIRALPEDNDAHYRHLRDLVTSTGKRSAVFLGLAFKKDTDDLRGSPMLRLAADLAVSGWEIAAYDPAIEPARLIGANAHVVASVLPDLERHLVADPATALARADAVVVVSQRCVPAERLSALLRADHTVIDVNGWNDLQAIAKDYVGLCW
jgi:GDP-mannose 6-dehydrogenase